MSVSVLEELARVNRLVSFIGENTRMHRVHAAAADRYTITEAGGNPGLCNQLWIKFVGDPRLMSGFRNRFDNQLVSEGYKTW